LVEPDNPEALAAGIESLYGSAESCASQSLAGLRWVEQFDILPVARRFLETVTGARTIYTSA